MIAYHCDANLILAEPFTSRKDKHRLLAYDKIMQRLSENKLIVDLKILDNEASVEYKRAITKKWKDNYQLLPPTHTGAMHLNAPFARSRPTFSPYSRVSLQISREICGAFYSPN